MQASPPATQRGKFKSNTYLPVLENPDFQLVQVEVLLVETTLARAALLHHHLPSHLLGLQVVSPYVIFNFFIGIYTVHTGHIIVIFGTLMI